ncbi:PIN-like domain-containing protein [Nocardia sp. NPDC059229]|uniref:PIN-like domain-containing protein n=1 Tax=Nocardia sp. NPDC059229 TaxID=3346778 RepID=UPI0036B8CD50
MEDHEPLLMRRYQAWIVPAADSDDTEREVYFKSALVVLDTNVLLDLYEYTPQARSQVFAALELISPRLWLPHQVGLEFVRGRHSRVKSHDAALRDASDQIGKKFGEAVRALVTVRKQVQHLLQTYTRDEQAQKDLEAAINNKTVDDHLKEWAALLRGQVKALKDAQDHREGTLWTDDSILQKVANLFDDRVGEPPHPHVLRQRVEDAFAYRFPNEIPPGFADADKSTPLRSAGDYLLWEEVIEQAAAMPEPRRVLLVSSDTKEDWYEPARDGAKARPWPMLFDEIRQRAGAELRIEQPQEFFDGIRQFLDADIGEETSEEIKRAAELPPPPESSPLPGIVVTEMGAAVLEPTAELRVAAYQSAGLTTSSIRRAVESPAHRLFQWWLIGVTAELGRRNPGDDEPLIEMLAAVRSIPPPGPDWLRGTVLRDGEWPYRSSTWIAPWFAQVVQPAPEADRLVLQRLAARQADLHGTTT